MPRSLSEAMAQSEAYNSNAEQWPRYSGFKALKSNCKEIRLLQLETGAATKNLRYIMRHEKLRDSLNYSAVSYSWGAPVPVGALREISINGVAVRIRPTLYAFLQTMKIHDSGMSMWIDAICINQCNVAERNGQISVMSEIFKTAQRVYVWLGPGDDDTSYAMKHIEDTQPQTHYDPTMFAWCAEKLLRASYWTRRWVIQEFALARELTVVCGGDLTKWDSLTEKINEDILENAAARQTLKSFLEMRSRRSLGEMSLLELMEQFQDTRCFDLRDRAFALRGIAADGHELSPDYDESAADVYFRLLSILPTERVLPAMLGYRWPHEGAGRLLRCMPVTREDVLSSVARAKNDRLYAVFEYIGLVATVTDLSQDAQGHHSTGEFCSFHLHIEVRHQRTVTKIFRGSGNLLAGDLVYSLQSTQESPKGLYIAFRPYPTDSAIVGMLIQEPDSEVVSYWADMGLCEKRVNFIRDITLSGALKCSRNNMGTLLQTRILCHVNRLMLVLLWLLHVRQVDHLWSRREDICKEADSYVQMCPLCDCDEDESTLEILPSSEFQRGATLWTVRLQLPWTEQDQKSQGKQLKIGECQLQGENFLDFSYQGRGGLSYAAGDGLILFTKYFLSEEAVNVDSPDDYGTTPLWWAACNGHDKVVKMLLNAQADANVHGGRFGNILYTASEGGHERVVRMLIDTGADVNARGGEYGNALQAASAGGSELVVQMLIDAGADVDARGGEYGNALQAASACGNEQVVKVLLGAGMDISYDIYRSALLVASHSGYKEIVQILVGAVQVGCCSDALQKASYLCHKEVLEVLLSTGVDVNAKGEYGNALQAASANGNKQVVKMLLDAGADVNAEGELFGTALQAASGRGHKEIVKMLLEAGADVNAQGGYYGTALQAASDHLR